MAGESIVSTKVVKFSDGGSFETRADSASEYLLDPVFMRFILICVLLYGLLAYRENISEMGTSQQVTLWLIMFGSTIGWLMIGLSISLRLLKKGYIKTIFTPLLLFPMVLVNVYLSGYVAKLLQVENWVAYPENLGLIATNLIIVICFDILHGRYVAPAHPTVKSAASNSNPPFPTPAQSVVYVERDQGHPQAALAQAAPNPVQDAPPSAIQIKIGNEVIDTNKLRYIRSEDHYLKITLDDKTMLVREKMKDAVLKLEHLDGMQISRSVWVAFNAIQRVHDKKEGKTEITLSDNSRVNVPRMRKLAFNQQYDSYLSRSALK